MAKKSTVFEGFIHLVDNIYMKPCDVHPSTYDLYEYKPSTSPRHPDGKMDDIAFSLSIEYAIKWACHRAATERGAENLKELLDKLQEVNQEIYENVQSFIND